MHERDLFEQPLSEPELRTLLTATAPAEAFAWLETPYLIRRPVVRIRKRTPFGFNQRELETIIA